MSCIAKIGLKMKYLDFKPQKESNFLVNSELVKGVKWSLLSFHWDFLLNQPNSSDLWGDTFPHEVSFWVPVWCWFSFSECCGVIPNHVEELSKLGLDSTREKIYNRWVILTSENTLSFKWFNFTNHEKAVDCNQFT